MIYVYHPKHLKAVLFSASAVKNGLPDEDFIYAFTRCGLQLPASETFEDVGEDAAAIGALGACLQVVCLEKHFAKTRADGLANVVAALETLRVKRHPLGLGIIEITIEAAKSNFTNPLSSSDAWMVPT